jgi:O-antigen/teichoic acid export membrane protein
MNETRRPGVFKGAQWLVGSKAVSQAFSWAGTFLVATTLAPGDYGLSVMATVFTEFARIFADFGVGVTLIQKKQLEENETHNLFTFSLCLGLFFGLLCFPIAILGSWYFQRTDIIPYTQFTAVIFLTSALTIVPYNLLNRHMRFRERGLVDVYSTVGAIAGQVTMAYSGFGTWTLILGVALRQFIQMGFAFYFSGYRPRLFLSWRLLKGDMKMSVPLTFNQLLVLFMERSIPLILGRFFGAAHLGYLSLASTLSDIPNQKVVQILREILLPLLSRREGRDKLNGLQTGLKVFALLILPLFITGFYYGSEVLDLIFPDKWAPMFPLFEVLCLSQIPLLLCSLTGIYFTADGKPSRVSTYLTALSFLIPVVTFLFARESLLFLCALWTVIRWGVFLVWFWYHFRGEPAFLARSLGMQFLAAAASCAPIFLDHLLLRFLPEVPSLLATPMRVSFFLVLYGGFLAVFHRDFILGLRHK